jgi:DNA adenine methylase
MISQNRFSPLRYPGGKGKITNYVAELFEINGLNGGHYVEPFAGGAAIALGLLFHEHAYQVHINDFDRSIYSFWHSVLFETEAFCRKISSTRVSLRQWREQREIQKSKKDVELFDLGYSTFFLNRTNRSGILNAGVIGGVSQMGKWRIDARFNKKELIARIERIAAFSDRIKIYNLDACDLLTQIVPSLGDKTFVYLDPPYFKKGNRLYHSFYRAQDHDHLAKLVQDKLKTKWLVSYDDVPEIRQLYEERRQLHYSLSYSARNYYNGSELMVFDDRLVVPTEAMPIARAW